MKNDLAPIEHMISHARRELRLIGEKEEVIAQYEKIIDAFVEMRHSGSSAGIAVRNICDLLQFKNLSPLTDDPSLWINVGTGVWQSCRNMEAFSEDGGKTYYLLSETIGDIKSIKISEKHN